MATPSAEAAGRCGSIALDWAREGGLIARGDRVVLVRGTTPDDPSHNAMIVQEVD